MKIDGRPVDFSIAATIAYAAQKIGDKPLRDAALTSLLKDYGVRLSFVGRKEGGRGINAHA